MVILSGIGLGGEVYIIGFMAN